MVMHECDRVGLSFIDTAPFRFVSTVDLAITPEQLFEVLADAESWPHWATAITKVTWTSPEPRGVGTTRTVNMRGGIVGDEEFLAWEPFTHMAFRFNEASSGSIAAFAEDYRVVPTAGGLPPDLGDGDEAEGHRRQDRDDAGSARDGPDLPEVSVQPARLHRQAVLHRLNRRDDVFSDLLARYTPTEPDLVEPCRTRGHRPTLASSAVQIDAVR